MMATSRRLYRVALTALSFSTLLCGCAATNTTMRKAELQDMGTRLQVVGITNFQLDAFAPMAAAERYQLLGGAQYRDDLYLTLASRRSVLVFRVDARTNKAELLPAPPHFAAFLDTIIYEADTVTILQHSPTMSQDWFPNALHIDVPPAPVAKFGKAGRYFWYQYVPDPPVFPSRGALVLGTVVGSTLREETRIPVGEFGTSRIRSCSGAVEEDMLHLVVGGDAGLLTVEFRSGAPPRVIALDRGGNTFSPQVVDIRGTATYVWSRGSSGEMCTRQGDIVRCCPTTMDHAFLRSASGGLTITALVVTETDNGCLIQVDLDQGTVTRSLPLHADMSHGIVTRWNETPVLVTVQSNNVTIDAIKSQ